MSTQFSQRQESTSLSANSSLSSQEQSSDGETAETQPSSVSSVGDFQPSSSTHDNANRYLLLCVNSAIYRISLAQVDLTPKYCYGNLVRVDDESMFRKVKEEYTRLRGTKARNLFIIPRTIQFVKVSINLRSLIRTGSNGSQARAHKPQKVRRLHR